MKKILLVDDEPDLIDILAEILREEGYEVFKAANGAEAMERLRTTRVDLLVLDLMMPVMSGEEVLEALARQSADADLPVLVVSAGDGEQIARRYGRPYLRKPFELDRLLEILRRLSPS